MSARHINDAKLPFYALRPDGTTWNGSGQSGTDYYQSINDLDKVGLGLSIVHRQGPAYEETSIGQDGTIHFDVAAGPQPGNPGRAEWSFNYAAFIDKDKAPTDINAHSDIHLLIDVDPTNAVKYLDLILKDGPQAAEHLIWVAANNAVVPTGTVIISDDGQNPGPSVIATENSQNIAFYLGLMTQPYAYGAGAEFDISMVEMTKGVPVVYDHQTGNLVGFQPLSSVHVQVDVL